VGVLLQQCLLKCLPLLLNELSLGENIRWFLSAFEGGLNLTSKGDREVSITCTFSITKGDESFFWQLTFYHEGGRHLLRHKTKQTKFHCRIDQHDDFCFLRLSSSIDPAEGLPHL